MLRGEHPVSRSVRIVGLMGALLALVLVSGCGAPSLPVGFTPHISYDNATLRTLKAAAKMQDCPQASAPATGSLPNKTLPCLGGGPSVDLASLRGPLLVNVWAYSCTQCHDEIAYLEAFSRKYHGRVAVLGVDPADSQPDLTLEFARSTGMTYPSVADFDGGAVQVAGMPTTLFVDAQGKVVYEQPGPFTSEQAIEAQARQRLGVAPPAGN